MASLICGSWLVLPTIQHVFNGHEGSFSVRKFHLSLHISSLDNNVGKESSHSCWYLSQTPKQCWNIFPHRTTQCNMTYNPNQMLIYFVLREFVVVANSKCVSVEKLQLPGMSGCGAILCKWPLGWLGEPGVACAVWPHQVIAGCRLVNSTTPHIAFLLSTYFMEVSAQTLSRLRGCRLNCACP